MSDRAGRPGRVDREEVGRLLAAWGRSPPGLRSFQEDRGMPLLAALGFPAPRMRTVAGPEDDLRLADFPGERVVVKLLDPAHPHRTEVGGVRVVPREEGAVRAALAELARRVSGPEVAYLVQEWVPHEAGPGGELLLGYRWTRDFGPVVTLAPGGVDAELLVAASRPGALQWIGAPGVTDPDGLPAALGTLSLAALAMGSTRGRAGRVSVEELARAVRAFLELAGRAPAHGVHAVEVNPLVFRRGRAVPLDVLVQTGGVPAESPRPPRPRVLDALLRPRSIAVVGASARHANPGRVILRNVVAAGFPLERIQVLKEGCRELEGAACVPELASLAPVDLMAVAVSASEVAPLLTEVARRESARSVVLVSAGMGEGADGEATRGAEEVERALALPGAPAVNGGNCLGVRSRPGRYDTLFLPPWKVGGARRDEPHPVALLAQSGAFAVARLTGLPWLDPRYVVTVGNQVDLTVGEYLEHFADDPEVRVVGVYVEGFRPGDGRRFLDAAGRIRARGGVVVLLRAGRTEEAVEAMASHTASVAGDWVATRALALQRGVLVAEAVQDFQELLALAVRLDGRRVEGRRAALLSNAGFECVGMADSLGLLEAAVPDPGTRASLAALLDAAGLAGIVAPRNPLDLTPTLGDEGFARAASLLLGDAGVDVGVVGCVPLTPALQTLPRGPGHREDLTATGGVAGRLGELWRSTEKGWVAVVDAGPLYDPFAAELEGQGIPVLRRADRAVTLLGRYVEARLHGEREPGGSGGGPTPSGP